MPTNKTIIQRDFDNWANGTGSFFDLLDDNVEWTISGSSPLSKTYYGKKQFMDEVIIPLNEKLSKKIIPKVRHLYEEDDVVIAIWDGRAEAKDGRPYYVTYAWFMQMKEGKIIKVTAFLDTLEFADIMKRF